MLARSVSARRASRLAAVMSAVLLAAGLAGCAKREDGPRPAPAGSATTTAPAAAAPTGAGHAPAGVRPGSHEDWCAEHEVPESQCTRCNPDLVPAFKATSDWCPEHGLPESQCKLCNPSLVITRPPKGA